MNYGRKFVELAYNVAQDHISTSGITYVTKSIRLSIHRDAFTRDIKSIDVNFGTSLYGTLNILFIPMHSSVNPDDMVINMTYRDTYANPMTNEDWEALLALCQHEYAIISNNPITTEK